ncbi:MAG: AMP-binding protein [Arcobacteraceae bacterium]|nr:AMP-binding protein [Arcobacteraceae bacterium]
MKINNFGKTALIFNDKKISYKEVIEKIGAFYSLLDIPKGEKVALFCENRPEWIYSLFTTWQKEAVCVLIDYLSNQEEVSYILNDSKAAIILTSKQRLEVVKEAIKLTKHKPKLIIIDEIKPEYSEFKQKEPSLDNLALLLYTSGTTGKPKGVMLTFRNLYSNINSIEKTQIMSKDDSVIALLPFHHSYPLMTTLLSPLSLGLSIAIVEQVSSESILKTLQKNKISIFIGVPRLYDLFHNSIMEKINSNILTKILFNIVKILNIRALSKLIFSTVHNKFGGYIKYFVSGGAKLYPQITKDFEALGFNVIEGYGLTETSPIISFNPPYKTKLGSCGKVIQNVEVKIIDKEIAVKGDNVMKGYYNLKEKTDEAIKNGWFYTGDLGSIDKEGYLFITGRKKDMIVLSSGKNINPEEVENSLVKVSNFIKEAAVIQKDENLFAIIYPNYENLKERLNIQETIKWEAIDVYNLKALSYKKITGFKIVNQELPKTRLGKIKHFQLKKFLKNEKKKIAIEEPKDKTYEILKNYLEKVSKEEVIPQDNIEIDLGLDSLAKIELLTFIDVTFAIEIDEKTLSKHLKLKELYKFIKEKKTKIEEGEVNWKKILSKQTEIDIPKNNIALKFLKPFMQTIFKLYFRLEVKGTENLPKNPFIIVANHQSFLDAFLISSSLPQKVLVETFFIAEETFFKSSFKKFIGINIFHVILLNINTNLKSSLQKSVAVLKEGKNIILFPEGARTRDGKLLEFKKLFAILAKELEIPIVPVAIEGAFEAYPVGKVFPKPKKIKLTFLKPIKPKGSYESITAKTKEVIAKELQS